MRLTPNPGVSAFFKQAKTSKQPLYLSVLTIGEIEKGIAKLIKSNDSKQAEHLKHKLQVITQEYESFIIPIDTDVSTVWGTILANTDDTNAIDKLIAATAAVYGLTVVTRNIKHIQPTGVTCLNPFTYD